ncbi:hypothetical protein [Alteromonas sp. KUL49]|uniref:hypothetical protein n=1 Tax=Alteromonas sp. KUL49 TaxID=2480798 RepID=UPI00102F0AA3|nr:hypothetical protein [Alteromonas sp. KUL49]TAP42609.1 hypothetical protein EYS00_03085 [Alteromonas sp. KUL49]GEA10249.1 hypothetical protein KUL49_06240 [Alteromonas sp. KUL49]
MFKWMFILLSLVSVNALADNESLSIETRLPAGFELAFPNESNIQPEISDFTVLNFVPMSNEEGERWVVITVTNTASGRRTLNQNHLMALVADGSRIHPQALSQSVLANETLSIVINFGMSKFPLLNVYSRTEK